MIPNHGEKALLSNWHSSLRKQAKCRSFSPDSSNSLEQFHGLRPACTSNITLQIFATLTLYDQPDPRTARLNPTATDLQLHLPLREGGFGVSDFPPAACAAAFISSVTRAASALSAAVTLLHPFSAPTSATSACWHFLHTQFPDLCPSPAEGFTAATAAQLTSFPTQVRNAFTATNRAELTRLWPNDRAQALRNSICSRPDSMWHDAVPYAPSLRLDDQSFEDVGRVRMGVRTFSSFGSCS
jgi:hypothetical protein